MSSTLETKPTSRNSVYRVLWGLFILFVVMTLVFLRNNEKGLGEEELAQRIQTSTVTWPNYEEDIKAIAASAAAEWQGELTEVRRQGRTIQAVFRLQGRWADRAVALPILLKEARGGIYRNNDARCGQGTVEYTFELPEGAETTPPAWVELKYPHGQRRVALSDSGQWSDKAN